eukprot:TRINITY_DN4889_c0_g1_i1.p1 TRINITY_DN4889_c0_g1~~TRINITY_DN4889_c0_g1_i1.p1  ORF type:complete len:769 (-),score=186.60 TRINITY_DN4889_c0_g1_i1:539-2845(-)
MEEWDQEKFEDEWKMLESGFRKLLETIESSFTRPFDNQEYIKLYSIVYNLCTQNKLDIEHESVPQPTEILYQRYGELLRNYLQERKPKTDTESFLHTLVQRWTNHKLIVKWLQKLFTYLDRYYTKHNSMDSLRDCGLKCFNSVVYEEVKLKLFESLLENIQEERNGQDIDRRICSEAINLFVEMGMESLTVYEKDFETPFLERTAAFYRRESARWIAEDSATEYMRKAEERLAQEHARAQNYLNPTSEQNLIRTVEVELLTQHQKVLVEMENSGIVALLRDQKLEDLARAYRLFSRIPKGLEPIAVIIKEFCTDEGARLVKKHAEAPELDFKNYVTDMIELHDKYSTILQRVLDNHTVFQKAIKDAFESFINQNISISPNKKREAAEREEKAADKGATQRSTILSTQNNSVTSSELLANYCDLLMKNSADKMSDDDLEEVLDKVVSLFGYISDKDLFHEFYRKQLSRRLLMSNTNDESERSLISKLKMKCGAPYTSKLEGMINDRNVSEETQNAFRQYQQDHTVSPGFEFTAQVLTTGFWPIFKADTLDVPDEVKHMISVFKEFYNSRTQSRVLKWVHSLGSVTLTGNFKKGAYHLSMNAYQACALLLFNSADTLTGSDVEKGLGLQWEDVKKALQSLAMGKYKLLLKTDDRKEIKETDEFTYNVDFQDRLRKLKIPNVVAKVNPKASQLVLQQVEDDRRHAIEACVVRLMKSRKMMEHATLIGEAIAQLSAHFKPDPKVIKRRIDDLIAREYLERDAERTNVYRYLA